MSVKVPTGHTAHAPQGLHTISRHMAHDAGIKIYQSIRGLTLETATAQGEKCAGDTCNFSGKCPAQTPVSSVVVNVLKCNNDFNNFQCCFNRQISYKCEMQENMTIATNKEWRSVNDQIIFLQQKSVKTNYFVTLT
jgi:hypothetical protein